MPLVAARASRNRISRPEYRLQSKMAGHSKWANIRHRKERMDNKRGKAFSRLVKEIYVAAKLGGEEAASNPRLRLALQKAKEANLPKDNIEKAIKRGAGKLDGETYQEIRYEGHGPSGIAFIVDCLTDNRNRTTAAVRHAFSKHGGSLGTDGSVSYMFERVGQIVYAPREDGEKVADRAIELGASDITVEDDGSIEVLVGTEDFHEVLQQLEDGGLAPDSAEVVMRPSSSIEVDGESEPKVRNLLEALEECDDTQQVYSNAQLDD